MRMVVLPTSDPNLHRISLLRARKTETRLDIIPFVVLYLVVGIAGFLSLGWMVSIGLMSAVGLGHVLLLLSSYWSVTVRARVAYRNAASIDSADTVWIVPSPNCGSPELCPLKHESEESCGDRNSPACMAAVSFSYQNCRYYYWPAGGQPTWVANDPSTPSSSEEGPIVAKLDFPVSLPLRSYLNSCGLSKGSLAAAQRKWGDNKLVLPVPQFANLMQQQMLAPFFVFQTFCVLLWCLDEYWYYSLFTLLMLVVFESTVAKRRIMNQQALRRMRSSPYPIYTFRLGKWQLLGSDELVPGDLVSLRPPREAAAAAEEDGSKQRRRGHKAAQQTQTQTQQQTELCPCDVLLLRGSVIANEAMLTGESVPKPKQPLLTSSDGGDSLLCVEEGSGKQHCRHVVYGGTQIKQATLPPKDTQAAAAHGYGPGGVCSVPRPPNGGCIGYVLKTGFYSSQGDLMRTILFASEHVTANSTEVFVFLAILLLFAVAASSYVLYHGLADPEADRWKLFLHCIMIVTSVVPPELPMELSLAVNTSLAALHRAAIFCTQPFRIPLAGKLDVCCFDKTGTLTCDTLEVKGVRLPDAVTAAHAALRAADGSGGAVLSPAPLSEDPVKRLTKASRLTPDAAYVLATCHSLVHLSGKLAGDPLEMAAVSAIGWSFSRDGVAQPSPRALARAGSGVGAGMASQVRLLRRFPFSSSLKRMSAVIAVPEGENKQRLRVVCKGAPETIASLLDTVPADFRAHSLTYARAGFRVLALATKLLPPQLRACDASSLTRAQAESGLRYCGLLVLSSRLKPDSGATMAALMGSGHRVVVITGDNPLTAVSVARSLRIVPRPAASTLVLNATAAAAVGDGDGDDDGSSDGDGDVSGCVEWVSVGWGADALSEAQAAVASGVCPSVCVDGSDCAVMPFSLPSLPSLARRFDLAVTGSALAALAAAYGKQQQQQQQQGDAKVGDGDGDGAAAATTPTATAAAVDSPAAASAYADCLRQLCPHVRVFARVSPREKERIVAALRASGLVTLMCGDGTNDVGALKQADVGVSIINNPALERKMLRRQKLKELEEEDAAAEAAEAEAEAEAEAAAAAAGAASASTLRQRKGSNRAGKSSSSGSKGKRSSKGGKKKAAGSGGGGGLAAALASLEAEARAASVGVVQLGDASIASPFTSRTPSVKCTAHIIRQGRCTLVTTLQMFKILAVNCLVSAYCLSSLYLHGVKQGDTQATLSGLAIAAFFLLISRSQPLPVLSPQRPRPHILCAYVLCSVLAQFAVHLASIFAALRLALPHTEGADHPSRARDGDFAPNVINSAVFLTGLVMQVNSFAVNYKGHPFMQSLRQNSALLYTLLAVWATALLAATDALPAVNELLELVPFPHHQFRCSLVSIMLLDTVGVWLAELLARTLFKQQQQQSAASCPPPPPPHAAADPQ